MLGHHRLLLRLSTAAAVAQRVGVAVATPGLPELAFKRPPLAPSLDSVPEAGKADAWLFLGCVMDAWLRPTHVSVQRVMEAAGTGVAHPGKGGDCCGALHTHAGLEEGARAYAERVMASMPGDGVIVVDSAGCGAALKGYGHVLGTAEARGFSARVRDVHEWLAERLDRLPPASRRIPGPVAIQDPCHLRHVQKAHQQVRTVLGRYSDLVELDDEGLCCGAGGAYAALHPDMAAEIRARKLAAGLGGGLGQPGLRPAPGGRRGAGASPRRAGGRGHGSGGGRRRWRVSSRTYAGASTASPRSWPTWPWPACGTRSTLAAPSSRWTSAA